VGEGESYVLWFSWIQSYSVAMKPNQLHTPSEYAPESKKYSVRSCVLDLPSGLVNSQLVAGVSQRYARIRTPDSQNIISRPVNVRRTRFHQAIWHSLQPLDLPRLRHPTVLFVVIAKYRSPRDLPINHRTGKLSHDSPRIPRRPLAVELVAGEDDHVGLLEVKCLPHQCEREIICVSTVPDLCIPTDPVIDTEVEIGNLKDFELTVLAKVESWRSWRYYESYQYMLAVNNRILIHTFDPSPVAKVNTFSRSFLPHGHWC
jgi:hypothetical protein